MTDAAIAPKYLRQILLAAVDRTYWSLTVDGDMSTNDMVALLVNGASGVKPSGKERETLQELIACVMGSLARQICCRRRRCAQTDYRAGARLKRETEARQVAKSIANSLLVKMAIAGNLPELGPDSGGGRGIPASPSTLAIWILTWKMSRMPSRCRSKFRGSSAQTKTL